MTHSNTDTDNGLDYQFIESLPTNPEAAIFYIEAFTIIAEANMQVGEMNLNQSAIACYIKESGKLVGMLTFSGGSATARAWVDQVYVLPSHRNVGIYGELVDKGKEICKHLGWLGTAALIHIANEAGLASALCNDLKMTAHYVTWDTPMPKPIEPQKVEGDASE